MRHCVFCAGKDIPKNKKAIELANKTYQRLEEEWMLEHDCILQSYHSVFEKSEDEGNIVIWLTNDRVYQLIQDCMEFASLMQYLKDKA